MVYQSLTAHHSSTACLAVKVEAIVIANLLPIILESATDRLVNVRIRAARLLGDIAPRLPPEAWRNNVVPCLQSMLADEDLDVRYYSQKAIRLKR